MPKISKRDRHNATISFNDKEEAQLRREMKKHAFKRKATYIKWVLLREFKQFNEDFLEGRIT